MNTQREIIAMVRQWRYDHGVSRLQFADRADLADGTLASFESRGSYPSLPVAVKLADAMGITLDELVRKNGGKA